MVTAAVIAIGDELLSGAVPDCNSGHVARRLSELGVAVGELRTLPDRADVIRSTLKAALAEFDVVIAAGGLGPTPDDVTKGAAARLLGRHLVLDDAVSSRIEGHFAALGRRVPAASTKQALVPEGAIVLENPVGLAPGLILSRERHSLILLPGVPAELHRMLETGVVPYLEDTYFLLPFLVATIRTTGISESAIVEEASPFLRRHKTVRVSYLPNDRGVDIKLWTEKDRRALIACQEGLRTRLNANVYAVGSTQLEEAVGELLRARRLSVSTAESCTGGLLAERLSSVPGSSDYFRGGAVTYSNDLKRSLLGVTEAGLRKSGAVSAETAARMAAGARERFATDLALAVTGIAGPGGATTEKPVGLVFIGLAGPRRLDTAEHRFSGTRQMIRERAATAALDLLRRKLSVE
jgi:nicotinamide-nucleotide amidase